MRKQIRTEAPCCPNIISCNVKVGLVDSVEPADVLRSGTLPHETLVVKPVQVPAAGGASHVHAVPVCAGDTLAQARL